MVLLPGRNTMLHKWVLRLFTDYLVSKDRSFQGLKMHFMTFGVISMSYLCEEQVWSNFWQYFETRVVVWDWTQSTVGGTLRPAQSIYTVSTFSQSQGTALIPWAEVAWDHYNVKNAKRAFCLKFTNMTNVKCLFLFNVCERDICKTCFFFV